MESQYNGRNNAPTIYLKPSCQTSRSKDGLHLVESLSKESHRPSPTDITGCYQRSWLFSITWEYDPIVEDTIYLCHWTWRDQADSQLEGSPLLASIHEAGMYFSLFRGEKSNCQYHPDMNTATYNSDLPVRYTCALVPQVLWQQHTTCTDLGLITWDGTHTWQC